MLRRGGCSSGALVASALLLLAVAAVAPRAAGFHLGGDESGLVRGMLAAIREQAEAEDAARFAVAEYNKNQVVDSGKKSLYSAKVWVKPWLDFKAVVEFRHIRETQSQSSVAADGSAGQDTADPSLAPRTHLHKIENNEVSFGLPSFSQTYSA
uniref:Cysteine proteinase inhibitor n=1 Tax=Leersia perrieri TaxID=77586 RepID=A0A0D9WGG0_9ORYZ